MAAAAQGADALVKRWAQAALTTLEAAAARQQGPGAGGGGASDGGGGGGGGAAAPAGRETLHDLVLLQTVYIAEGDTPDAQRKRIVRVAGGEPGGGAQQDNANCGAVAESSEIAAAADYVHG